MAGTSGGRRDTGRHAWPVLLLPVLALFLVLPLLRNGASCGHDFSFHVQSWIDAADQIRHGVLLPHWAYSPAFNAGEPRFVFYPPLSWLLGAALLAMLPANLVPAAFTAVALTLAGWGMWALARRFTGWSGALLAAAVYLAEPYMLFTAFERTAYAELLAAAWLPWLLREAFAEDPRVLALGVPVALLWLTNAPAAVMGTYTLALVAGIRAGLRWRKSRRNGLPASDGPWRLLGRAATGMALGMGLAGFYLLPAAWERRFVEINMAVIPTMRVQDNFLFGHTGSGPHDQVLRTASLIAVSLLGLTGATLGWAAWRNGAHTGPEVQRSARDRLVVLLVLALVIALLQLPVSFPVWRVLPELSFLQFPWRWLVVLGCVFGTGVAMLIARSRLPLAVGVLGSLAIAAACGPAAMVPFREGCDVNQLPQASLALFRSSHGVGATDEYTPDPADNDQLRWDDPPWWLAANQAVPGPNTVPNPAATIENYDQPPPLDQTVSGRAPMHLQLHLDQPEVLILNLRDYPAWEVTVNGAPPPHLQRDDGLIAVALPAGADHVEVRWRRLPDVWIGDGLTVCALGVAGWLGQRSRKIRA